MAGQRVISKAARSDLGTGFAISLLAVSYALSYGALLFSAPVLTPFVGYAIAAATVTTIVAALMVALLSQFRFAIAGPDSNTVAVLAGFTSLFSASLAQQNVPPETMVAMVLTGIFVITLVTGLAMYLLGRFEFGNIIRFVPVSVAGGFLGAAGILMMLGAWQLALGMSPLAFISSATTDQLTLAKLSAFLAFAAIFLYINTRATNQMALPAAIIASIVLVYIALYAAGIDSEAAQQLGVLFSLSGETTLFFPLLEMTFPDNPFSFIISFLPEILVTAIVSILSLLLISAGIELDRGIDSNLNHELRIHGYTIGLSAFLGGFMGYTSLSRSLLNVHKKSRFPVAAVMVVMSCVALLVFGSYIIPLLPKLSLAALVMFLGFQLAWRWLVESYRVLDRIEYTLILLICFSTVYYGYIVGLSLGVVAGCILFAARASIVNVVRQELSGEAYKSRIVRSRDEEAYLADLSQSIRIYELQGFLFFGTTYNFYAKIKDELENAETPIRHIILSFRHISGIDASAEQGLQKIFLAADRHNCNIMTIELPGNEQRNIARLLKRSPTLIADQNYAAIYDAMEAIEENLLREREFDAGRSTLTDWLTDRFGDAERAQRLYDCLEEREYQHNEIICEQNEPSDELFFLDIGRIDVISHDNPGQPFRIYSYMRHTMLGEMGFVRNEVRSAQLVARGFTVIHVLKRDRFEEMLDASVPEVDSLLQLIAMTMSDRIVSANRTIAELQA